MTPHPIIIGVLLSLAVALAIVCSVGLLVMRDAFQRMQFAAPVVSISTLLIIVAVFFQEQDIQARIKVVLTGLILFFMNAVLTHATARAMLIRKAGHWGPEPRDRVPIEGSSGALAGQKHRGQSS